jgi:RNA polymerase sigma-70 factor (ECF subfamily)
VASRSHRWRVEPEGLPFRRDRNPGPALPDAAVLAHALEGDEDALRVVFRAYHPGLLRYLRGRLPTLAEDLAAQSWLDAVRNRARFVGDAEDFRRWLYTIARRRVQDELRRRGRRPEDIVASVPETGAGDAAMGRRDSVEQALELVRRLPPDQADAVLLRVVAGMDVAEVAEVMERSEGSVRVLVHRGLRRLRELVEAGGVDVGVTTGGRAAMDGSR